MLRILAEFNRNNKLAKGIIVLWYW